jgi:hypothetical protein
MGRDSLDPAYYAEKNVFSPMWNLVFMIIVQKCNLKLKTGHPVLGKVLLSPQGIGCDCQEPRQLKAKAEWEKSCGPYTVITVAVTGPFLYKAIAPVRSYSDPHIVVWCHGSFLQTAAQYWRVSYV